MLEQLVKGRSRPAADLWGYYKTLINTLDRTLWYRHGKPIRARAAAIPARVLKAERDRG